MSPVKFSLGKTINGSYGIFFFASKPFKNKIDYGLVDNGNCYNSYCKLWKNKASNLDAVYFVPKVSIHPQSDTFPVTQRLLKFGPLFIFNELQRVRQMSTNLWGQKWARAAAARERGQLLECVSTMRGFSIAIKWNWTDKSWLWRWDPLEQLPPKGRSPAAGV